MGDRRAGRAKNEPNLELPGLFGRRKKRRGRPEPDTGPADPEATEDTSALPQVAEQPQDTEPTVVALEPEAPVTEPEPGEPMPTAGPGPAESAEPAPGEPGPAELNGTAVGGSRRAGRAARPGRTKPLLPAMLAAVLTGLLVGLFGALLTGGSLRGCEAVRGTSSCGGPGFFLLVAIVVVMVLVGGLLLAAFRVPEPRSTSFLAVGMLTVVVLVTLMEELFSPWMFVAVPVLSAATYALARWVTTRFVDTTEPGPDHDVR